MEAARAWGVPVSEIRGRTPQPGEPRWTPKDRQIALALTECEAMTHTCGQPITESFDETNEAKYETERRKCYACAAIDKESRALQEEAQNLESDSARTELLSGRFITLNTQQMEKPE